MIASFKSNIVNLALIAIAFLLTAKFGTMVPYKESYVTLIWLPTGIAVGTILRYGQTGLAVIFILNAVFGIAIGIPVFLSLILATSSTFGSLLSAYLLKKFQFNYNLVQQRDIALMIMAALIGMLVSSTVGTFALHFHDLIVRKEFNQVWVMWWLGDSLGVILALPLMLNISKKSFHIIPHKVFKLLILMTVFAVCELLITALIPSLAKQFMLSIFLILPILIGASMSFGIVGGSLVVITLSAIAVWSTAQGYGAFYSKDADEGIFSLWAFMLTLVIVMLLITILQAKKNQAEKELRNNEKKLRAVIDGAIDGIVSIDETGALTEFNPAAERIFGYRKAEVLGKSLAEVIIPPSQRQAHTEMHQQFVRTGKKHIFDRRLEMTGMRADGSEFPVELTITSLIDDGMSLVTGFLRDISQQKKAQQEIENFAYYDTLTGLPNRRLLIDRYQRTVLSCMRTKAYSALIFIDLDNFKALNDTKGHDAGDQLLVEVARRILNTIRGGDTVARLSGDEFVVIIENLDVQLNSAYLQAGEVAQKLLAELNKTYLLGIFEFNTTASIGVTLFNDDLHSLEDNLRHADTAMYQSKAAGRNTYRFYDQSTQVRLDKNLVLETALHSALKSHEFHLVFQSIVDDAQSIIAAEVLLRWIHPTMGEVSPAEFIPLAEKNNLIIKIGYWVLQQACLQIKRWESTPSLSKIRLSINISAKQFLYVNFVEEVRELIESTGINADLLKLELTETAVIDNLDDVISKINVLRQIGVRIALDDFGMGHSSLVYLKKIPITQIKIDQSFVKDMLNDSNDAAIIKMVLAVGNTIQCSVVAEGVEQAEQFETLKNFGCRFFQGFYFSQPVKIADFEKMVDDSSLIVQTTSPL